MWLTTAGFRALKWFAHEFLLLSIRPLAASIPASLCRLIGCTVVVAILHVELQNGLVPNTLAAIAQCVVVGLTAILFGNVAKEFAFDLCARFVTWSGRPFPRRGLTVTGRKFYEIHYRDGTWTRHETGSAGTFCEWTEPDGCCNRIEVRPIPVLKRVQGPPHLHANSADRNGVELTVSRTFVQGHWPPSCDSCLELHVRSN
jgi:hypothetical protein